MPRFSRTLTGVFVVLLSCWPTQARATGRPRLARGDIGGTIETRGCSLDPWALRLSGKPVTDADRPGPHSHGWSSGSEHRFARIERTSDPQVLEFTLPKVIIDMPYRLRIKVVGQHGCGKILWRAPDRGLVTADPAVPLAIEGFVMRSKLEVLGERDPRRGRPTKRWVGSESVVFDDPGKATRALRWTPNVPGAVGGRLQVATRPFPTPARRSDPCATPAVVYSRDFRARRVGPTAIPGVDFNRIASPRPDGPRLPGEAFTPLTADERQKVQLGAPLYARVVPLNADGQVMCATGIVGVPPMIIIAEITVVPGFEPDPGPPAEITLAIYEPPVLSTHPSGNEACYRVTKDHYRAPCSGSFFCDATGASDGYDYWLAYYGGIAVGATAPAGHIFCVPNSSGDDDGWFEDLLDGATNFVTGFVDGVGWLVNEASALWEKIQDLAVEAVATALDELQIVSCDTACKAALELGLEVGLASMGIPPSLPNFDELVDQGLDYLAAKAAEQAGIPEDVAVLAKDIVLKAAEDMKSRDSVPGLPNWLAPDMGVEPAVLTLRIFSDVGDLPKGPLLLLGKSDVFSMDQVWLPRRIPPFGSSMAVPVVLSPNLEGLPEPPSSASAYAKARHYKARWRDQRLTGGCARMNVPMLSIGRIDLLLDGSVNAENFEFLLNGDFHCQP